MPIKFFDELTWSGAPSVKKKTFVDAGGPITGGETIQEVCAWVYQRSGGNEAAATEMTTTPEGKNQFDDSVAGRWKLRLTQISDTGFRDAPAFAVAMALLLDASGNERVVWWGHPIELIPRTK